MINVSSVTRIHYANSTRIEAMISVFLGNELKNVYPCILRPHQNGIVILWQIAWTHL